MARCICTLGAQSSLIIIIASNSQPPATNKQTNYYLAWAHQQEWKPPQTQTIQAYVNTVPTVPHTSNDLICDYNTELLVFTFVYQQKKCHVKFAAIHQNFTNTVSYADNMTMINCYRQFYNSCYTLMWSLAVHICPHAEFYHTSHLYTECDVSVGTKSSSFITEAVMETSSNVDCPSSVPG